jgi:hypothetical protein
VRELEASLSAVTHRRQGARASRGEIEAGEMAMVKGAWLLLSVTTTRG